jgi:hypothetical protein
MTKIRIRKYSVAYFAIEAAQFVIVAAAMLVLSIDWMSLV